MILFAPSPRQLKFALWAHLLPRTRRPYPSESSSTITALRHLEFFMTCMIIKYHP